jgi:hypothetical protein
MSVLNLILPFGAMGIGAASLYYSAGLLKQAVGKKDLPRDARNLVVAFMIFGLLALGIGGTIEIMKENSEVSRRL